MMAFGATPAMAETAELETEQGAKCQIEVTTEKVKGGAGLLAPLLGSVEFRSEANCEPDLKVGAAAQLILFANGLPLNSGEKTNKNVYDCQLDGDCSDEGKADNVPLLSYQASFRAEFPAPEGDKWVEASGGCEIEDDGESVRCDVTSK